MTDRTTKHYEDISNNIELYNNCDVLEVLSTYDKFLFYTQWLKNNLECGNITLDRYMELLDHSFRTCHKLLYEQTY